ncbi:MAG: hypothetical protein AAB414_01410 [Patescibacteria group bacterium]
MKKAIILFFYIPAGLLIFYFNFFLPPHQEQFISLASSFLQGKLYFLSPVFDASFFENQYFWPLGPFPAILLMPFVFLSGGSITQGYLLFFLNIFNLFLLYRISKKVSGNSTTSIVISFAVIFSTAYLGIALIPWSWYFAQSVGFGLTLLALEAYFFNRTWLMIGVYVGLAFATRVSLIFTVVFFILSLLFSDLPKPKKIKNFVLLFLPIVITCILIGTYNWARFGNILEGGYSKQLLEGAVAENRAVGLWSFAHFPANLYSMFLKMPESISVPPFLKVDGSGLSLLITSSIFIWIIFSDWKNSKVKFAAITCLFIIFFLAGSFTNGSWQYGSRYAIDYYPFLFIMLLYSFKKEVSSKFIVLTAVSFLLNLFFLNQVYNLF